MKKSWRRLNMGFMDLFKTDPEESRERDLVDGNLILAYLEDLARTRATLTIHVSSQDPIPYAGTIQLVNEQAGRFTMTLKRALNQELTPKSSLTLIFALDGSRLQATVKYLGRGGYLQIEVSIPEKVAFADRREKLRAKFGSREHASVTALEDLFQGTGVAGKLVNLSMEGLCMQVDRAIQIQINRKLEVNEGLFHRGKKLLMVRIQELPQVPTIECSGEVAWIQASASQVELGLLLRGLGAQESQHLEQVMTRRLPTFSREFPVRRRKPAGGVEPASPSSPVGDLPAPVLPVTPETPDTPDTKPSTPRPEPLRPAPEGMAEVKAVSEELALGDFSLDSEQRELKGRERLLHWRRNSKHILVVMADDLDRAILTGTLQVGGFTNIHEAKGLIQAIERCKKHLPDLLLVDAHVGPHTAPDIVTKLRSVGVLEMSPVVLLVEPSDVKVKLASRALRIKHLVEKPVDYDGLLKALLDKLLDLK